MNRCKWPNLENNDIYIQYHDNEYGRASYDDEHLFEMLVLESFHCGLSWLIILKKRNYFKEAFDNFNISKIATYNIDKVNELLNNENIVRNKLKIEATINNAKVILKIIEEYDSLSNYLWSFTNGEIIKEPFDNGKTTNYLSDKVSKDMKKKGMKFMGSVTVFSYLSAIGIINNHATYCDKYKES